MSSQKSQIGSNPSTVVLELPVNLVYEELEEVQKLMSEYLDSDPLREAVIIDGRQVRTIDIVGLQLLVWFQLKANQGTISWELRSSRKLISTARMFGLSEFIQESTYAEVQ